jgi:hypothetical protein
MYLGTRAIRSAGRTSGSIEITLPPDLQPLTGLGCRVMVRDGLAPEIVLQPDLSMARARLTALWSRLRTALDGPETPIEFSPTAFVLTLMPTTRWQGRPALAYADVLAMAGDGFDPGRREAAARVVAALAGAAGAGIGLAARLAVAFGEAVAYLATGTAPGFVAEFERALALELSHRSCPIGVLAADPDDTAFWREGEPALRRILDQFLAWQEQPERYERSRERWYRGVTAGTAAVAFPAIAEPSWRTSKCPS